MVIEKGKSYWEIVSRYHRNRHNKALLPIAMFELAQRSSRSPAVQRRVQSFIGKHQSSPPSNAPNGGGGMVA